MGKIGHQTRSQTLAKTQAMACHQIPSHISTLCFIHYFWPSHSSTRGSNVASDGAHCCLSEYRYNHAGRKDKGERDRETLHKDQEEPMVTYSLSPDPSLGQYWCAFGSLLTIIPSLRCRLVERRSWTHQWRPCACRNSERGGFALAARLGRCVCFIATTSYKYFILCHNSIRPPPSFMSPLIHQAQTNIPKEFQLSEDVKSFFQDGVSSWSFYV
jgi:hypothetical protein